MEPFALARRLPMGSRTDLRDAGADALEEAYEAFDALEKRG